MPSRIELTSPPDLGFTLGLTVLPIAVTAIPQAQAQLLKFNQVDLVRFTAENPFERFPDGRPKVPDSPYIKQRLSEKKK